MYRWIGQPAGNRRREPVRGFVVGGERRRRAQLRTATVVKPFIQGFSKVGPSVILFYQDDTQTNSQPNF